MNVKLCVCLIPVLSLAVTGLARADIDLISITAGPAYEDGVLTDYFLSFEVEGSGITGGEVNKGGATCTLEFGGVGLVGPENWVCEVEDLLSLQDICQLVGFGDFDFEISDSGGLATVTLAFDPGCTGACVCTDPFTGHAEITSPVSGGTVPPIPGDSSLCWDCSSANACGDGDYFTAIVDSALEDIASDYLPNVSLPACWKPGICMPIGDYAFAVSALEVFDDLVPALTDQGDPFVYGSAFESFNFTIFGVTAPPPTTPPGVPEGGGVTEPMRVARLNPDGSTLEVLWDADSCCGAGDHHLVWGLADGWPATLGGTYTLANSECGLGTSGTFTWSGVPDPVTAGDSRGLLWWLVLADDASTTEGSWGVDSADGERSGSAAAGSSGQCGMTTKDLSNACGR